MLTCIDNERRKKCRLCNEITTDENKSFHANVRQPEWNDHNRFSLSICHRCLSFSLACSSVFFHAQKSSNSTNYSNITTHALIRVVPLSRFQCSHDYLSMSRLPFSNQTNNKNIYISIYLLQLEPSFLLLFLCSIELIQ